MVRSIMKPDRRNEFATAFMEWRDQPIRVSNENAFLFHASSSLTNVQEDVGPAMVHLHETGEPNPTPVERWHDGMSYLLIRETNSLRNHLRLGRNQVSTRALIEDSLRLQRAWDAYRRIVGK